MLPGVHPPAPSPAARLFGSGAPGGVVTSVAAGPVHDTYVEFDGRSYYWWCADPGCEAETAHYLTEGEAAEAAAEHVVEVLRAGSAEKRAAA